MKRLLLIGLLALAGCANYGTDISSGGVFVVAVGSEQFRVRIDNSLLASQARRMMNGDAEDQIIVGQLDRGDGGFNTGYGWHIKPATVSFSTTPIQSCNASPSVVQANIAHWVDTVKQYCPAAGRFISEVGRF